jgi:hypothetical protein
VREETTKQLLRLQQQIKDHKRKKADYQKQEELDLSINFSEL